MKRRKLQKILLASAFIFLILLLYIQISRLINTAETEKRHFTQSVKLSLNLAASEISQDRQMCQNVQRCLMDDTKSTYFKELKRLEWNKVDSIIKSNLEHYEIDLEYDFEIVYTDLIQFKPAQEACYTESLNIELQQGGIELRVRFPEKNKFIIQRISTMFVSSILLILLLMASFLITYQMYVQERNLAIQTKNFINNMAHEFKTPLASIGFANSRIKNSKEVELPEKLIRYTEIIENEKTKLQEHLSEMLELASLESRSAFLKKEPVNIEEVLKETIKNSCISLEEKKGEIEFNCRTELTTIDGNRTHLVNSFSNIIENACKYSNGNLIIRISCYSTDNKLIVEISDNGFGISCKDQKLVFDKFYRVPTGDVHNIKGYGIGLSYVKEVVEQHMGQIELKSKLGKGSTFKVTLPVSMDKTKENKNNNA